MRKMLYIVTALGIATQCYSQVYPHYSLYLLHPQIINYGAMAEKEIINGIILHKSQWIGFEGAPRINYFELDIPVNSLKSVFGASFLMDKIGIHTYTDVSIRYAYRVIASETSFIGFGTGLVLRFLKSQYTGVETYQTGDPVFSADVSSRPAFNVPFGFHYYTPSFYFGVSVPHLLFNREEFSGNTISIKHEFSPSFLHYHILTGFKIALSEYVDFYPSLLVKAVTGAPVQFDINMRFFYQKIMGFAISFRTRSELSIMLNYKLNDYIHIGYAYNYNFNQLSEIGSSSHEVALIVSIPRQKGRLKIDLPRFF